MSEGKLRVERDGPIGRMVFDNPTRRNAIGANMWRAIAKAMAEFDVDREIRCIVLRGEGNTAFAAGADISEFEQRRATAAAVKEYDDLVDAAQRAIEATWKPVVALIHGFCVGGGVEMALACDLRYAGVSGQFAIPAARLGVGYGVHGTNRLVATVGHAAAREIMFTGRRYSAEEALAIGLVNRVLPDAELDGYVHKIATQLADNAPLTIAASKTIINSVIEASGDFAQGAELTARCMQSEDYAEGRRAFMEKRPPRFKGR
ncbi:MAG: enoyl-CoA hydratase [Burkholderiales bacterium]